MRLLKWGLVSAALIMAAPVLAQGKMAGPEQPSEAWTDIRESMFPDVTMTEAGDVISLEAPYRAHDAAAVPVRLRLDPGEGRTVERLTLIVDENPAPVAAEFEIFPAMGPVVEMSTRLRVNAYSNVRAIVELSDGSVLQTARYVKASGGCSAPASSDPVAALAALGKMKVRLFDAAERAGANRLDAQIMIKHPNNSGFQLDQVTQLYVPARFVDQIAIYEGDTPVLRMEGGISLSEDPSLRFSFIPNGDAVLRVEAGDTDGAEFGQTFVLDYAG